MAKLVRKLCTEHYHTDPYVFMHGLQCAFNLIYGSATQQNDIRVVQYPSNKEILIFSLKDRSEQQWIDNIKAISINTHKSTLVKMLADRICKFRKSIYMYRYQYSEIARRSGIQVCDFDSIEGILAWETSITQKHWLKRWGFNEIKEIISRDNVDNSMVAAAWDIVTVKEIHDA